MQTNTYHIPVMLSECMEALAIKPDGIYVDVTFGGGGHSREILARLGPQGKLFAFDQDPDALQNALDDHRFTLIHQNFQFLKNNLRLHGVREVDGVLADLGVSSHQIDDASRGFSIRFDAELDMRMDQSRTLDAATVLNTYSEEDLHRIFGMYGELRNAKTLAKTIVAARNREPIRSVQQLKDVIVDLVPRMKANKYHAQLFQAIRIEVNKEMDALMDLLTQSAEVLKPGGRLVVMSYHSLEDRLVKNFMIKGKFSGAVEKDFYGNEIKPLSVLGRKPVEANEEEISRNGRARSAKLRVAVKN
ncbi:MAG TPA: 16S rRNA (cytosine(1402)-N(4))-methyltransferase RsmH [Sphingobacteriaceae bacterium]|nr:16S rRNA (cytosine(1402)-N(4))-methyltransferase RsmH [Sphingobacteriaceae bacterium]